MNENTVAEEEQRVYESKVKEETQAVIIVIIKQHPKHRTDSGVSQRDRKILLQRRVNRETAAPGARGTKKADNKQ
jgi:hypothetical protein